MTGSRTAPAAAPPGSDHPDPAVAPVLALASRGDALTAHLWTALERRYPIAGHVDAELSRAQRYLVAAATFRPTRRRWVERFYKSRLASRLRSSNAAHSLAALPLAADVVLQVHALFDAAGPASVIYVDCTHQQSVREWPDWNPLRGRRLRRWLDAERRQYLRAAHLFAFSEPTARSLREDYDVPADRVTVVGAGANVEHIPARSAPSGDTPPTVLFVGNDFVRKGGEVLLAAFPKVRAAVPDARLTIVGTPHPFPAQPGVESLGRVGDRKRMADLYRSADVFCVPSFFDPFPLVVLEAMAFGLPVVATTTCGVPEMVLDQVTGLLVRPGDPDALAAALIRTLTDPLEARRWGTSGRVRVETTYTWDAVVARMAPGLERLPSRPRTAPAAD